MANCVVHGYFAEEDSMRIKVTEDVSLRVATEKDADFVELVENCPLANEYLGGPSGKSEHEYRAFLKSRTPNLDWLIIERRDGSRIGRCGLFHDQFEEKTEMQVVLM